jgi:predicted metal-dependent peptidase
MNEQRFKFLLQELIDRNPFSVRAMLRIVAVEFTETVPTLAVTRESPPRMLVNLSFLGRHCRNDLQVKAVILHEFLHVLLRHTEDSRPLTPARSAVPGTRP